MAAFFPCPLLPTTYSLLATSAILVALTITAGTPSAMADEPIQVMSFNIRFDAGEPSDDPNAWVSTNGDHRRDKALTVIRDYGPDILGVQEAMHNQVIDLRDALPDHDFYGIGRDDGVTQGEYSGVFFRRDRFTKKSEGTFWLSETPDVAGSKYPDTCCARIASWVVLEDTQTGGRPEYFVMNTHWEHDDHGKPARAYSSGLIREQLGVFSGGRQVILMGDLNAQEDDAEIATLLGRDDPAGLQLTDSYRAVLPTRDPDERTYHAFNGGAEGSRIDYVLYTDTFKAIDASIVRTDFEGKYPSDHYPVTATLIVNPAP